MIPSGTTQTTAARALLSAASRPGNEFTADELVAAGTRHKLDRSQNEIALRRWDDEGGRGAPVATGTDHLRSRVGSSIPVGGRS
ncbi:hypothetical protein AB0M34_12030 [Nocardia sp. NPDC050193]